MRSLIRAAPLPDRLRGIAWPAGIAVIGAVAALLLASRPHAAAGATVGGFLLLMLVLRPRVIIGALLALGAIDLSFVTGGSKALLPALGGLDMNGIRLVGTVAGLAAIITIDRQFWRHIFEAPARWYLVFLAYAAATLAFSVAPLDGARLWFKLAFPLVIFIAVLGTVRDRADLERYADGVLWGAAAIVLLLNPIYVLAGGYSVGFDGQLRIGGIGLHPNPFSFYLTVMLLMAFARYSVRGQLRYLGLCAVICGWLVLTVTRISLAASLAGVAGIAIYGAVVQRNYRALVVGVLAGVAVAVPFVPLALERTFGHVPSIGELVYLVRNPVELYGAMNWQGRELLWPVAIQSILSSPIFGSGLGTSTGIIKESFPTWGQIVHNEYLRLGMETGLIGVALFASVMGRWWVEVIRAGRAADPIVREYALPAGAAFLSWAIISATDNSFDYYAQFTQYIGFLCAGAMVAGRLVDTADAAPGEKE